MSFAVPSNKLLPSYGPYKGQGRLPEEYSCSSAGGYCGGRYKTEQMQSIKIFNLVYYTAKLYQTELQKS